jgi:tRNA modification GTPase
LREASNDIEIEGVRRARDYIKKADLVFVVNDITVGITSMESIDNTLFKDNNIVNIYNKTDLLSQKDIKKCRSVFKPGLFTSALTGVGLGELKNHIITALDLESNTGENFGITTTRQYNAILKSDAAMAAVIEIAEQYPLQLELVSFELQNALNSIEDLLGTKTADEVLNNMFDNFCVGK